MIIDISGTGTYFVRSNHISYDSYGNITSTFSAPGLGSGTHTRYLFAGMEYDPTTGLSYANRRYYDAKLGKWINHDPSDFDGGQVNVGMYVGNDPVNYTDPSGLVEKSLSQIDAEIGSWQNSIRLAEKNGTKSGTRSMEKEIERLNRLKDRLNQQSIAASPQNVARSVAESAKTVAKNFSPCEMRAAYEPTAFEREMMHKKLELDLTAAWFGAARGNADGKQGAIAQKMRELGMTPPMEGKGSVADQMYRNAELVVALAAAARGGGATTLLQSGGRPNILLRGKDSLLYNKGSGNNTLAGPTHQRLLEQIQQLQRSKSTCDQQKPFVSPSSFQTPISSSPSRPPKAGTPNSIHEQIRPDGGRSITFYDDQGRAFSRQDFGQLTPHKTIGLGPDGRALPHEHMTTFGDRGPLGKYYRSIDVNGNPAGPWIAE